MHAWHLFLFTKIMLPRLQLLILAVVGSLYTSIVVASPDDARDIKFYRIVAGKVDAQIYEGFRRYHASCNHCHGPDGVGSTFAPSLVAGLPELDAFRRVVLDGVSRGASGMKGFAGDANVAPYVNDIYAYLQARSDGALGRGRPEKLDQ
jgi:mono/diheme cytochrome c family protein